ncbi:MAG: DUF4251 domain-containing protein [Mucilaginibacter sp.]
MKNLHKFLGLALLICAAVSATAQSSLKDGAAQKAAEVKNLVNGSRYNFVAEKALTKKGVSSPVSYGTGLDISKDTLIVYLPGTVETRDSSSKAVSAGITCVHFSYNMIPGANGSYDVSIIPEENYSKDVKNIKKISLHISKQGYADLTVITVDSGQLGYHGYIRQPAATFSDAKSVVSNY